MQYRRIPGTGEEISILGFGCMRLPVRGGRIDGPRAEAMLKRAVEAGINYFDTAVPYHKGESEPFLGRALAGGLREGVLLADKLSPWLVAARADLEPYLAGQLKRLRTDRIDYYLLHALDREFWEKLRGLGTIEFLENARRRGQIRNLGFSYHGDPDTFREIVDAYGWDFCQIQYNFIDRRLQAGEAGLEYAASRGLGVMIMEPLRGGGLVRNLPPAVADAWKRAPGDLSPAQRSLRWIWNRPEATTVLSGMSAPGQLEENLAAAAAAPLPGELEPEEAEQVERVAALYRDLARTGCTGCRYCLPCPAGVDIPRCFELLDGLAVFGGLGRHRRLYLLGPGGINGPRSDAALCTGCGLCETACPQGLPVRELLREADSVLGGWRLRLGRFPARFWMKLRRRLRRS
ncbi:MAG TPA: aldo/keto reductase [bacterium]|nr:aldo/keto reductase [bacterium]HPJ71511.1 aldo/keto reductase [bacterium]HPQ65813.1 aldo/keto reductase [bacterium]